MSLKPPNLDNRDFKDLVREARNRIPQYLPEWTDWNESDPGITLLQLHAWLTETILYRLNQLPDLNYIKFLQMLGVEQRPARPARADLTFILKDESQVSTPEVLIEKYTVVGVSARDLEEPLFFETDQTLRAITAKLAKLIVISKSGAKDETGANQVDNQGFLPFGKTRIEAIGQGKNKQEERSLLIGFQSQLPFSREKIGLHFYLVEAGSALLAVPEVTRCSPNESKVDAPLKLKWHWWDGVRWDDLSITDETQALTQNGQVYLRVPGQIPAVPYSSLKPYNSLQYEGKKPKDSELYYWLRLQLVSGSYARPPRIDRILTNTVRATAVQTVFDEAVGSSDGSTPNQTFSLRYSPVLAEKVNEREGVEPIAREGKNWISSLQLEVDEGEGQKIWTQVTDFSGSKPDDAHYVLNPNTGQIRFGDGRRGRIPVAGQFNIIARHYRYGGGKIGNVGAQTIVDLAISIPEVESVTNYRPASGGDDEEVLSDTKLRAAQELKSRSRAVTLEDFVELAKETPGALVARSTAYVTSSKGGGQTINVVVVPQSHEAKPVPSGVTRGLVCRYLDQRRLVTTQVQVQGPQYHDIDLVLDVRATDDADLKAVNNALDARLKQYFHPLQGGPDSQGWPFGRDVYYSELLREIMLLPGIRRVVKLQLLKLLPRNATSQNAAEPPYFFNENNPQAAERKAREAAKALLQREQEAYRYLKSNPTSEIVKVTVPKPHKDENQPQFQTHYYVAAKYDRSDLPVADGALVALRLAQISVDYDRGGAP